MKKADNARRRETLDIAMRVVSGAASLIGIFFLGWILWTVARQGLAAFNIDFFTELPAPPGVEGGGLANAIAGTAIITLLATLMGVPLGLFTGVYLSEFGKSTRFGGMVRFTMNITMGVPSIIVGLFVYTLLVLPFKHFSAYAGAVALAIIMLPVVARTTEDMLNLVPNALRESALAIGMPRWRMIIAILFRAARSGLLTGILLAVARVSGETAPLLFTAMSSPYWMKGLAEPTANLTVTIFNYAMSPFDDWKQLAWGASLFIMATVLGVNILARTLLRERTK
ncbi:MAG TPA: phosphate ABC transporter permease PstA [bacterium]|nr:phosphate ABC transporter permease PstA [bacterium]